MKKKPTVRKLLKRLDAVFSIHVRKSAADFRGMARCFTCQKEYPWKELQCGHYCSRRHMNTRFHEKNTAPQCLSCNVFRHGAMDDYALALQAKYGDGVLKELQLLKNQTKQFTLQELQDLIKKYEQTI